MFLLLFASHWFISLLSTIFHIRGRIPLWARWRFAIRIWGIHCELSLKSWRSFFDFHLFQISVISNIITRLSINIILSNFFIRITCIVGRRKDRHILRWCSIFGISGSFTLICHLLFNLITVVPSIAIIEHVPFSLANSQMISEHRLRVCPSSLHSLQTGCWSLWRTLHHSPPICSEYGIDLFSNTIFIKRLPFSNPAKARSALYIKRITSSFTSPYWLRTFLISSSSI